MTLTELGWNDEFAAAYEPWRSKAHVHPGRVAIEFNQIFRIYIEDGELDAVTAGRLKHRARGRAELPAVGDWVALRKRPEEDLGVIMAVLPRRSAFTRRAAGEVTGEQVVAANVVRTREVRASDSRGRHTTTHRELVVLPGGGLVIDTPGMRELQLWDAGDSVRETFDEIEALAPGCHFTDCRHRDEPRCAVKAAVAEGKVAAGRLESYIKVQDELATLARQQEERARKTRR